MENMDSDYSVRLATLEAIGGDVTKQYDSVYAIDQEILALTGQGGGGKAIEEVDELPEAPENKDKLFRLDNGEKDVYAAKLLSFETITTNRLPDEQQIDKAYLYLDETQIYYYKGSYTITCSDGVLNWYLWEYDSEEYGLLKFATAKNAVNVADDTPIIIVDAESEVWSDVTETSATTTMTMQEVEEDDVVEANGYVIPAIYNAPESAQIGNAYIDSDDDIKFYYTGEETTIEVEGETITVYSWYNENEDAYIYSTKPASEIYYSASDEPHTPIMTDTKFYDDFIVYTAYIPQLNAPDSEQAGNAYILASDEAPGDERYYTGTAYTLVDADESKSYNAYAFTNGEVTSESIFTLKPANEIYNENADDIEVYETSMTEYELLPNNTIKLVEEGAKWYKTTLFDRFGLLDNTCYIVKYQRTETTEEWGWENILEGGSGLTPDAGFNYATSYINDETGLEGKNIATGNYSNFAEGSRTKATSQYGGNHAEGYLSEATGSYACHAEGYYARATAECSHAEGSQTQAVGGASHAEGESTITSNFAEHAEGIQNVTHRASTSTTDGGNTRHSIGIGQWGTSDRKNAVEVMANGDVYIYGIGGYLGTNTHVQDQDIDSIQMYVSGLETYLQALE